MPADTSETTAKASSGSVISMPAPVLDRPSCSRIRPTSGGMPVTGARSAMAMKRMPTINRTGRWEAGEEAEGFMPPA